LYGLDGTSSSDLWAVGAFETEQYLGNEALIEHWDGSTWSLNAKITISGDTSLLAVDAIAPDDAWAVGYYGITYPLIEHWDGTGWFISQTPTPGVDQRLFGVAAVSPTDIWAVGNYKANPSSSSTQTLIFHWDGTVWTQAPSPSPGAFANQLSAVDVVSSNDVWAVGNYVDASNNLYTLTEHWDGTTWSLVPSPAPSLTVLTGVTAIASNDVWAVGSGPARTGGFSIHWDGTSWRHFPMPLVGVEDIMHGIASSSSTDVWAVGEASPNSESWQALALHWTGSRWTFARAPSPAGGGRFFGVADLPGGEAWAVGSMNRGTGEDSTFTEHFTTC